MKTKRVIFCTYPSVYSDVVLAELLQADDIEVVGAVVSTRILHKNYGHLRASFCQIMRSGFSYAIYLFVITSLYTFLAKVSGKPGLRSRLKQRGVPVLSTNDINDMDGQAFIAGLRADTMLSAHFNQLVGQEILSIKNMPCLNIHPSLLPQYKGVDPAFYALLREESSTGVTVHFQDVEFDTGRILSQQKVVISAGGSLMGLNLKLFRQGAIAAVQQIRDLSIAKTQVGKGSYDSWPSRVEVRAFRRCKKLFRWREFFGALS